MNDVDSPGQSRHLWRSPTMVCMHPSQVALWIRFAARESLSDTEVDGTVRRGIGAGRSAGAIRALVALGITWKRWVRSSLCSAIALNFATHPEHCRQQWVERLRSGKCRQKNSRGRSPSSRRTRGGSVSAQEAGTQTDDITLKRTPWSAVLQ
jgi:hypothetical protein